MTRSNRARVKIPRMILAAVCSALLAPSARAQQGSGVAGVARDTSGGILPGVTVEAASPVLIEKVRSVVTDGEGRYNIVDLRPGTYTVTFTLPGFSTFRREGIELSAGFTATVNGEMRVGALAETITVTGASPLVDTQNVRQQKVVSAELLATLPTSMKTLATLITLIPGLTGSADVGGASGVYKANAPRLNTFHGKVATKISYDGMNTMNLGAAGSTAYITNAATAEETTVETGGVSAESTASGVLMNMIPKEGGNAFKFSTFGMYTNVHLQSDNLNDNLRARGLTNTNDVLYIYDANVTVGGPIKQDRLWFFTAPRFAGNKNRVAGVFYNKTQGTPFYTPDLNRPTDATNNLKSAAVRLTWQASPKNKVNGFADIQLMDLRGHGNFVAKEAESGFLFRSGLYQITWNSPRTNKLLLEAGASLMHTNYPRPVTRGVKLDDISILEASTNFRYNAAANYNREIHDRFVQRFSVSYVTGSRAFKGGAQIQEGFYESHNRLNGDMEYRFLRGLPNQLTLFATPNLPKARMMPDLGLFVQDQWTVKRLALNYGLRFDYFYGYVPAQQVPATQFVPVERSFARVTGVPNWKDLNPRLGASYDLFGDGRTALKMSLARYVGMTGTNIALGNNPITTTVNSVNRTWNDANGNYVPDCDLRNPAANVECGAFANQNFGTSNITTRWADDVLHGFGVRDYLWDFATEVQHQFGPGVSMTGGYYRNWSHRFPSSGAGSDQFVTDNLAVTPADYTPYCITAPVDARLPGGGGNQVCGLYDLAPAKFGQVNNLVTQASNYGKPTRVSNFFGVSINTRLSSGMQLGGGADTGRTVTDKCYVVDSPQELLNCRVDPPWLAQTQVKLFGSYPLPGAFVVSGTFQNVAGPSYTADYPATNDEIKSSLGRNLAACGTRAVCTATAPVPLVAPQTLFEGRQTQLDLRLTKLVKMGSKARLQVNVDVYNALNATSVLNVNSTFGPRWRFPTAFGTSGPDAILWGRLFEFGGQLSF